MKDPIKLPEPECQMGFTRKQIEEMFGTIGVSQFFEWMSGQTVCQCDGKAYNHEKKTYEPTGCTHPTSTIYYMGDVKRYVEGLPIID